MEGQDGEGEALEEGFEYRQQEAFADAFDRADELELSDRIDQVDVVEPLDAVQIALVDGIDPQEAGLAVGGGFAPLADVDLDRVCLVHGAAAALVGLGLSEVVEVAIGDPRQAGA